MRIIQYLLPLMILTSAYGHQTTIKPILNDISLKKICKSTGKKKSKRNIPEEYTFSIELYTSSKTIRSSQRAFPQTIELNTIIEGIPKTIILKKSSTTFCCTAKQTMASAQYKSNFFCSSLETLNISMMLIRADFFIDDQEIPYIIECNQAIINEIINMAT